MSAYNVVLAGEEVCPRCGSTIARPIQFKYGDTWQYQYQVGDRIAWGGNDIGELGHILVVVLGYPDECPVCGQTPDGTYDITIREDIIVGASPSDGTYDYVAAGRGFFVLEP